MTERLIQVRQSALVSVQDKEDQQVDLIRILKSIYSPISTPCSEEPGEQTGSEDGRPMQRIRADRPENQSGYSSESLTSTQNHPDCRYR
ncbi:hypothetical protein [Spirosoma koreense]